MRRLIEYGGGLIESAPQRAIGAVVARFVHTEEVTGSNPVSPTVDDGPELSRFRLSTVEK